MFPQESKYFLYFQIILLHILYSYILYSHCMVYISSSLGQRHGFEKWFIYVHLKRVNFPSYLTILPN